MPELPETETIARDLDAALRGAVIRKASVLRGDVTRGAALTSHASPRILGVQITRVHRRAKSIVLEFASEARLVVTPRFTGALRIAAEPHPGLLAHPRRAPKPDPYCCLQFLLADGRSLQYVDVRRLGTVELMPPARFVAWDAALGPEPLDPALTAERFSGILRGSNRAVKSVLMEQKRLAGVGNIYANEALWRARIRPARRATAITRAEASTLLDALREVLRESIALRGTTFRDFQDAYGRRGGFAAKLAVYGRGGERCTRCAGPLKESHALEGRSTVWCPACQR